MLWFRTHSQIFGSNCWNFKILWLFKKNRMAWPELFFCNRPAIFGSFDTSADPAVWSRSLLFTILPASFRHIIASEGPSLCAQKLPFHSLGKNRPILVNYRWRHSSFVNKHVCRSSLCKVRFVPLGFRLIFVICMESCWKKSFSVMHRFTVCQLWHKIQLSLIKRLKRQ